MKKPLRLFLTLILTSIVFTLKGQQTTFSKFIITEASIHGIDYTPLILDQGAYTVFYTSDNDGQGYMANHWPKNGTQSFGPTYTSQAASYDEPYETYKTDIFYFNWQYENDYNSKKGTAKVKLTKIYKPRGIEFILEMTLENLEITVYKGYMDNCL